MLPLSEPIRGRDGTLMTEIPFPKGSFMFLNLRACNTWKALWGEDAYEWKPERWLQPLPREVLEAHIPGIYANLYVPGSSAFGASVSDRCVCGAVRRSPAADMRACESVASCHVARSLKRFLAEVSSFHSLR